MKFEITFEDGRTERLRAKNIYEAFQLTKDKDIDFMHVQYFRPAKIYRALKINSVSKKAYCKLF